MHLWMIRHAIAERDAPAGDDTLRPLSPKGRRRFRRGVIGLARLDVRFDHVLHSPWLRARETADLLAGLCVGSIAATATLSGEPDVALLEELRLDRIALVGHEPWLSRALAWMVCGARGRRGSPLVDFRKGGAAHLVGEPRPGRMRLVAFYPPSALRALGRK